MLLNGYRKSEPPSRHVSCIYHNFMNLIDFHSIIIGFYFGYILLLISTESCSVMFCVADVSSHLYKTVHWETVYFPRRDYSTFFSIFFLYAPHVDYLNYLCSVFNLRRGILHFHLLIIFSGFFFLFYS